MTEILSYWISSEGFVSIGNSFRWTSHLLWMYIASGTLGSLSYISISAALIYFIFKHRDVHCSWIVILFLLFIFTGGITHILSIWILWHPDYWLDASIKMFTAIVSIATALLLWPLVTKMLRKTDKLHDVIHQLGHEIAERKRVEHSLQESQKLLRQLSAYQEQVKEDERKRIAREIHDELGQNLMALRIDVSVLQVRTGKKHPKLHQKVRYAMDHIDSSIKAVRTIINNLRPSVLDLGLQAAIEWQVKEFERRTRIACDLAIKGDGCDFGVDDNRATALFRILQESLNNVTRHAQATIVNITLHRSRDRIFMTITDNGVGIFPDDRRRPHSFGLIGIEERISTLKGEFTINSIPGEGTILNISIPIDATAANPDARPLS